MADLIKKIKIKKQDGTFTDYIPIGAEASNVSTEDGMSVEHKLKKKPYYFDNVADMKAATYLKNGDMAVTLGYYEINDGGGAKYYIIDTPDETKYQEKVNDLYAELIIKDNTINVKQVGIKNDNTEDIYEKFQLLINKFNNIIFPKGEYKLNKKITLSSNLHIKGDDSIIYTSFNDNIFVGAGENKNYEIYRYVTNSEMLEGNYKFLINDKNYTFTLPYNIEINSVITINPELLTCTIINNKNNLYGDEIEIDLINEDDSSATDITNDLINIGNVLLPSTFIENIAIDNITFINQLLNNDFSKYAILITNGKNIKIYNCVSKNIGLVYIGTTHLSEKANYSLDSLIENGQSQKLLSENIDIKNNKIYGIPKENGTDVQMQSSGVYLSFVKNCNITNNIIKYLNHGISIWGGNVGKEEYGHKFYRLCFANNIIMTNNNISIIRNGGIWTSRASNNLVSNNNISYSYDTNIDFEGSYDCIASNNTIYGGAKGFTIFYHSIGIIFEGNIIKDCSNFIGIFNVGISNFNDKLTYNINNNEFYSTDSFKIIDLKSITNNNCCMNFNSNLFHNVGFNQNVPQGPDFNIINNKFESNIVDNYSIININLPDKNGIRINISNNIFTTTNINNENECIRLEGKRWGNSIVGIIKDNIFENFNKCIFNANEIVGAGNKLTLYIESNKLSGTITDNNNTASINVTKDNYNYVSKLNVPNSIPIDGYHLKGEKIYFDEFVDNYIGAICTESGNPGTWKKFGLIESTD